MAHAMRCVNDTLPPRARRRWLLITMRLSIMSFAGMVRTLVAVGIDVLWSMLVASVFAMPLSTVTVSCGSDSAATGIDAVVGACAGIGCGLAGAEVVRAMGVVGGALSAAGAAAGGVAGAGSVTASGIWASPPSCDLGATASVGAGAGAPSAGAAAASASPTTGITEVGVGSATGRYASRIGQQLLSTDSLSTRYRSYISSTSHSLAPNSPEALSSGVTPVTGLDTADRLLSLLAGAQGSG